MKSMWKMLVLVGVLGAVGFYTVNRLEKIAPDSSYSPAPTPAAAAKAPAASPGPAQRAAAAQKAEDDLASAVGLTADQRKKRDALRKEFAAIQNPTKEQRVALNKALNDVLTPEQRKKAEEYTQLVASQRAAQRGNPKQGQAASGTPKAAASAATGAKPATKPAGKPAAKPTPAAAVATAATAAATPPPAATTPAAVSVPPAAGARPQPAATPGAITVLPAGGRLQITPAPGTVPIGTRPPRPTITPWAG